MTTPHVLHWNILRWNFDVEHVDMIHRNNVQYRVSAKEAENLAFSGGKRWWNRLKLSWNNSSPLAHHFHRVSLPGSSGAIRCHAKHYRPGQRLLGSARGWKKRDKVTIWQVNKMHGRQSASVGLILSSPIRSAFSHYCWGWCGLPSLATAEDNQNSQDLVCLLSLLLRKIGTARMCCNVPRKFQSISSTFAPWKSQIFSLFGVPPSSVSLTWSILAPKWAAPTMKLCTEHCAWASNLHVPPQNVQV